MKSVILNTRGCGVTPGFRYDKTSRDALQRAVDEVPDTGGRTIYVPTGICGLAGATVEVGTTANATGTARMSAEGTVLQTAGSAFSALSDVRNNRSSSNEVPFEGLTSEEEWQRAA